MEIINNIIQKPSILEVQDFEVINNIVLPKDYRDFLFTYNGGIPVPNGNINPSTIITYLLGMNNNDFSVSLYKHINLYKNRLPFSTFPIATDPFGNLFIMSVHPEGFGHIYFWAHEEENEIQDGYYTGNCYFVAYSFTNFLKNLH